MRATTLQGFLDVCRELIATGRCNLDARNANGHTSLHTAADFGHRDVVELLLDHGASVNLLANSNYSALYYASSKGACAHRAMRQGTMPLCDCC